MANEFGIFLRVFHPAASKERLVEGIGMVPTVSRSAGDPRRTAGGKPLPGTCKESFATFDIVPFGAPDLTAGLAAAARMILEKQAFISRVLKEGGKWEVYISGMISSTWGETVEPEWLRLFGQHDVALVFDILPIPDECEGPPQ